MKKVLVLTNIVYIFLIITGSAFAVGERTIILGGKESWRSAEIRTGIAEIQNVRPNPVLSLSSVAGSSAQGYSAAVGALGILSLITQSQLDLSVSFDERDTGLYRDSIGNYRLTVPPEVNDVDRRYARAGTGAVLFGHSSPIIIRAQNRNALFASDSRPRDFTIEFWLNPLNLENGEQIFTWIATKPVNGNLIAQRITGIASRNRLQWSFVNFFTSINGNNHINIEFSGNTPVIPKVWSHHLIRFDASTGMIEYLVDGSIETIVYATATGRENSEVYTPVIGFDSTFLLGERFSGLMDEFKIHNAFVGRSTMQKYNSAGGRIETRAVDLGQSISSVNRINVSGGRASIRGASVLNEFRENGRFKFSDDSEMNFFIRASENPYLLNNSRWVSFVPGENVSDIRGRYVQIAADFYPSADGESSPYLEQISIVFLPGEPPFPPRNLTASAVDGGVQLNWRHSSSVNKAGYLVYYSSVRGELFGTDAVLGPSPIDVGMSNSVFIDGLRNGTLYYFRVAAYDIITEELRYNVGEFSAEVTARPLTGLAP